MIARTAENVSRFSDVNAAQAQRRAVCGNAGKSRHLRAFCAWARQFVRGILRRGDGLASTRKPVGT
jgi:hypothetical protein